MPNNYTIKYYIKKQNIILKNKKISIIIYFKDNILNYKIY